MQNPDVNQIQMGKWVGLLGIFAGCLMMSAGAAPKPALLAQKGQARMPIVISSNASPQTIGSATTLATYLGRISGAPFVVSTNSGEAGIVVGSPGQFTQLPLQPVFQPGPFHREDYVLFSNKKGLWLIGATDAAVEHAVWDLLYRFGYRQFFPGKTWEVVPSLDRMEIAVDVKESPDFYARRIWYNWGFWGYNNQPYREWCLRNRHIQGFQLNSGHSYESIIGAHRAEFEAHPEYLSLVGGTRRKGGDAKFCISNPGLRELVVRHAVDQFKAHPELDSISLDPSDGDNWCECEPCAKMGSPSDRALTLANAVADAINKLGLGDKYVGMYAYNRHCAPPTIAVHPKVIISATTAFIRGGYSLDQIIEGWQRQGATMGIYDYFSVVDWDWNLPGAAKAANPVDTASSIREFHRKGVRFYDCESGDAWGPYGLGYYVAARVMWDTNEASQVTALIDDFVDKAFGPAREPMKKFYTLLNLDRTRRAGSDRAGRMYRFLAEARGLAQKQPEVLARISDLVLYTRYMELYNLQAASGDAGARNQMITFAYRIRTTMMIHAYGIWARTVGQGAAHDAKYVLKNETPVTEEEIKTILEQGIAANKPVEMGFTPVEFSQDYVPATPLNLPEVSTGKFPSVPQDRHTYYIWVAQAPTNVVLQVTVQRVWNLRPHQIQLYSPLEVSLNPVAESSLVQPDGKTHAVSLRTPYEGLHRVELRDGGDYTRIVWPEGLPVMMPSALDTPSASSFFRGGWTLYCYVPKGTKILAGWAARVAQWAPRISGTLNDPDGKPVFDFGKQEEGWFSVPVPPGQDGRLWKFENSQGLRQLVTIPPCLARNGKELLLPREVVNKDTAP
jgi:hypothetical protein